MNPLVLQQLISQNATLLNSYQQYSNPVSLNLLPSILPQLNYQASFLQARNAQLAQLKNLYFQNNEFTGIPLKLQLQTPCNLVEGLQTAPVTPLQLQTLQRTSSFKLSNNTPEYNNQPPPPLPQGLESPPCNLRTQLERMVQLILSSIKGKEGDNAEQVKALYAKNPILLQLYDKLIMKYYSAKKCREDIVRYILRKAFKTFRTDMVKKERVNQKKASLILCKRYFHSKFEELQKSGVNLENDEALFEFIMPFKKNSKNKTMNTNFVLEVFSSEEFTKAYLEFLSQFEELIQIDNKKKMEKLLDLLVACVEKNDLTKLGAFNRLPWLDIWLEDTISIANSLVPKNNTPPSEEIFKRKDLKK